MFKKLFTSFAMHDKRVEALTSFQKESQSYPFEPFNQIPSPKINVVIFPWEGVEVVVCNIEEKERGSCKKRLSCKKGEKVSFI